MRKTVVLALLLFSACGSAPGTEGDCAGDPSLGGGWTETTDHASLELNASCKGIDSACGAFTFTEPGSAKQSTLMIAVAPPDETVCPTAGAHTCSVWRTYYGKQEQLHFACENKWFRDYTRGTP